MFCIFHKVKTNGYGSLMMIFDYTLYFPQGPPKASARADCQGSCLFSETDIRQDHWRCTKRRRGTFARQRGVPSSSYQTQGLAYWPQRNWPSSLITLAGAGVRDVSLASNWSRWTYWIWQLQGFVHIIETLCFSFALRSKIS